jgi:hypothetical protein
VTGVQERGHSLDIAALLHAHGKCRSIKITHHTRHGLRLERASGLKPEEHVTVELRSGMRLPMRVTWVKGTSVGLRFLGPIAPGHPVMRLLVEAGACVAR